MEVTKTTAMAPMTVSIISCCACGRFVENRSKPTPTATLISTANAHTGEHRSGRDTVAFEERADDAHDEGRLQAFAQADEERPDKYALHALDSCPPERDDH